MTPAKCHPDRPNKGRGMCGLCYARWKYRTDPAFRARRIAEMRIYDSLHKQESYVRHKEYAKTHKEKIREYAKRFRIRHPDRIFVHSLKSNRGITQHDYDEMMLKQNGKCAICERVGTKKLEVDHDHVTNVIRGLVCHRCNLGLRMVDNKKHLQAALEYLKNPPAQLVLNETIQVKI